MGLMVFKCLNNLAGRGLFGWDGFLACRIAGVVAFVWVITLGYYFLIVFVQSYEFIIWGIFGCFV